MRNLFEIDDWKIIQNNFDPEKQLQAESIFSIGNGAFGQRANFEEKYTGNSLQGSYVGGVYYPDKTRVGWWKNGYPEYFAKVLNACNWIGIDISIDGEQLDLNKVTVKSFYRELDMQFGTLTRNFHCVFQNGKEIKVKAQRFCSMADEQIAAISYFITPVNFSGVVQFTPYLDGKVMNHDANYDEQFWEEDHQYADAGEGLVCNRTRKTHFLVATAMCYSFEKDGKNIEIEPRSQVDEMYAENTFEQHLDQGVSYTLYKYVAIASSIQMEASKVADSAARKAKEAKQTHYKNLLGNHEAAWFRIWDYADVTIDGDQAAQQAIRFNIFHLFQTYTGKNDKLNIGPKGFTGEKYGGATYWDTEAYCLPFFLKTADPKIAKQLLIYRHNQLDRAIENAEKLGFKDGAALYPMVTMNGEECHNEWEITFEEIHRNGAIAFAIYNYVRHTGDESYLPQFGRDVLVAISRFWAQRFNWSEDKKAFVMLGVTGPNEYENNVNNNWYTNYIAKWCLTYTLKVDRQFSPEHGSHLKEGEAKKWQHIVDNVYEPKLENSRIYLQSDGFMDKEQLTVDDIPENERPINQHWSWDRILRSIYIKQADVLQGIYLFEDQFDIETIRDNFYFYEPKTVHESSLSPCVHAIIASTLGDSEMAYSFYLRTSRLDLDDYNHETDEGLHITSMAGTWMSVVEGLAGVRIDENGLRLNPILPNQWTGYAFNILFRNQALNIRIQQDGVTVYNKSDQAVSATIFGELVTVEAGENKSVEMKPTVLQKNN